MKNPVAFPITACAAAISIITACNGQGPASIEPAIMLGPFIVAATPIPRHPWHYASIRGVEILSRAPDSKAEWWVFGLQRDFALQAELLPSTLTAHFSTPCTLILDNTDPAEVRVPELAVAPTFANPEIKHRELLPVLSPKETFSTNDFSSDNDTLARQTNLFKVIADGNILVFNGWDLSFRLRHYAPLPPPWFEEGICGKFGFMGSAVGGFVHPWYNGTFVGRTQFWLTDEETGKLQRLDGGAMRAIDKLPFDRIFSDIPAEAGAADLRSCEYSLFVRWALLLHHGDPTWTAKFWRFVEAASREPATEDLFRRCFGFGYARLDAELAQYLPRATRKQPVIAAREGTSRVQFRMATNDEAGRIIGDWLRMKGEALRDADSPVAAVFFREAGKVLLRAYRGDLGLPMDTGSEGNAAPAGTARQVDGMGPTVVMQPMIVDARRIRDPSFLAVYGLYAHDIGDDAKACELLEAAVAAGVQRPAAYRELAGLRFMDAVAHPAAPSGKLDGVQTAFALDPLVKASRMTPPSIAGYSLMADIWLHSAAEPSAADLAFVAEARALFPKDSEFAQIAAEIRARFGMGSS